MTVDSWFEGYIEEGPMTPLVAFDSTAGGLVDTNGNPLTSTWYVADWDALAAIPKVAAYDKLVILVLSANRLMRFNYALLQWQPIDSHYGQSIMYLGDSKSAPISPSNSISNLPVFCPLVSLLTNLNAGVTFVASMGITYEATAGVGVLKYYRADRTMSWTAPSDTEGAKVSIAGRGWVTLESATAGKSVRLALVPRNEPAADKTDSFNYSAYTATVHYCMVTSVPAMWNALNGNPFGENQYFYAIPGITSAELVAMSEWKTVYTDVTVIDCTTNGVTSKAVADQVVADIVTMITLRSGLGSKCIVAMPNLDNLDYTTNPLIPKWKSYIGGKLRVYCNANGIDYYSPAEVLNAGNSLSAPNVTDNFNADTVHYSQRGAYQIAKYLFDPVISKYAPKRIGLPSPLVSYDATDSPNGNLIVNGTLVGTAGTANTGVSGGVPTSFTGSRGAGTVITAVFSSVARTDKKAGNMVRVTVDNTGGADNDMIRLASTAGISGANFSAGDVLLLSGEFYIAGTGINGLKFYLFSAAGGYLYAVDMTNSANLTDIGGDTLHYVIQSMPFVVKSGFSTFVPRIEMFMKANGVATFDIVPNLDLRKKL